MLEVKGLVKDFKTGFFGKKVRVLHDVNFTVSHGEVFGFIGPNGSGKTTTFKSILGFFQLQMVILRLIIFTVIVLI